MSSIILGIIGVTAGGATAYHKILGALSTLGIRIQGYVASYTAG